MQKKAHVYLDYVGTSPLDAHELKAMLPFFQQDFENPSSFHRWGQRAEIALARSREIVSKPLGCSPAEVIFTRSVTESNNPILGEESSSGSLKVIIGRSKDDKAISELSTILPSILCLVRSIDYSK